MSKKFSKKLFTFRNECDIIIKEEHNMPRNAIKLLTANQLNEFNNKYYSEITDDKKYIRIDNRHYSKSTLHDVNESFRINSRIRNIVITSEMIKIFSEMQGIYRFKNYSIFDIMQAVNILYLTYQNITQKNVERILLGDIKIKSLT